MKSYIIIFILALVFTAWVTDSHGPPKAAPTAITDIRGDSNGKTVHDSQIADFFVADQAKKSTYATEIWNDTAKPKHADFPMVGF